MGSLLVGEGAQGLGEALERYACGRCLSTFIIHTAYLRTYNQYTRNVIKAFSL